MREGAGGEVTALRRSQSEASVKVTTGPEPCLNSKAEELRGIRRDRFAGGHGVNSSQQQPNPSIGIQMTGRKQNTSRAHPQNRIYPYLLRGMKIERANQVWAMDMTYIPMARGFVYLSVVMDWASRKVLAWRLSNTMTSDAPVAALEEAIARYGAPQIMNTDQGSQFTSADFIGVLEYNQIQISMDGKGCWRDNVFVERLWRSIKYENVYLHAYATVSDAKAGIGKYLTFFNEKRPHSSLDGQVPDTVYFDSMPPMAKAA